MILTMVFASFALGFATLAWRTNSTSAEEKAKVKFVRGKEWIQKTFAEPLWAFEQEKNYRARGYADPLARTFPFCHQSL